MFFYKHIYWEKWFKYSLNLKSSSGNANDMLIFVWKMIFPLNQGFERPEKTLHFQERLFVVSIAND